MFPDRVTHFLWASMILASCLARSRRMQESYAVVSAAAQFASACGLRLIHGSGWAVEDDCCLDDSLLPSPKDEIEALDRIGLAHSVYITDQSVSTLAGAPATFPYNNWPSAQTQQAHPLKV
ncbi:hypothetical protein DL93DRAFT_1326931 [Clavulina sp. PMI_390]|nr:hypothetical protein DL93DRAFT_1326931 [Clavulina sp. PMI_390]